jgi:cystathionine beta-lyase/cystathionine gamma-synthase
MKKDFKGLATRLIHGGEPHPLIDGAVVQPVFQAATYEYRGEESYHDIRYVRLNNTPNQVALADKISMLEGSEAAIISGSGMAAISSALLGFLGSGDHLLCHNSLYGGTNDLITKDFPRLDIASTFVDACQPETWEKSLKSSTKVFYVETMTNPVLDVGDLKAVVEFSRKHGLISIIDNTFASPYNFRAVDFGFDIAVHSATKYLNGHSDVVAGVTAGKRELMEKIKPVLNHLGGCLDPHASAMLQRGIKTLALRMRQHNENAQALAEFLEEHPCVKSVIYPGLESHPHHKRAKELLNGFGGVVSFEADGDQAFAKSVLSRMHIGIDAPSLGGIETLVSVPAIVSHAGLTPEERKRAGISDSLIRVAIGIEDIEDLKEDFDQALRD